MSSKPSSTSGYDALVIGSGQGGNPLAMSLAAAGRRTALVERAYIGGTCVNVGCTPTKTMVANARVAYLARRGAEYGVHAGPVRISLAEVRARKQGIVESFRSGGRAGLEKAPGLELLFGAARFTGPHEVQVTLNEGGGARRLTAESIFINVGCRPAKPAVKGAESVPILDSSSIMELAELPEHLIVLGGGYVGLEFGQMFRRFGSRVTIVQRGKQLLPKEDPDVASAVAAILGEDGIEVLLETSGLEVGRGDSASGSQSLDGNREVGHTTSKPLARGSSGGSSVGPLWLRVRTPAGEKVLMGTHLLAATGRVPNTEDLGLDAAGIQTSGQGFIQVNERLATSVADVYAIGDVNGGPAFTHISYDDFRILKANLLDGGNRTTTDRFVPATVFIDPQIARVGLSETEARAQGRAVRVAKLPMTSVARAIEVGETRGFMKAIVDAKSDEILGYTVLGIEGGELMSMMEIAMMGRIPWRALRDGIFAHPTLAESLNNLFSSFE